MQKRKNFFRSFGYAIEGILYTIKTQRNMQVHLGAAGAALLLSYYLKIPNQDLLLVLLAIFIVFILEMLNTAVEAVVNLVTADMHPLAKIAKDVAAGAVLLAAGLAVIIGCYVIGPPLVMLLK
jgi:undecaprenol kinase